MHATFHAFTAVVHSIVLPIPYQEVNEHLKFALDVRAVDTALGALIILVGTTSWVVYTQVVG